MKMLIYSKEMEAARTTAGKAPIGSAIASFVTDEGHDLRVSVLSGWRPDVAFVATSEDQKFLAKMGIAAAIL